MAPNGVQVTTDTSSSVYQEYGSSSIDLYVTLDAMVMSGLYRCDIATSNSGELESYYVGLIRGELLHSSVMLLDTGAIICYRWT